MGFAYIEEVEVTDATLISSTVTENDYPAWGDSPAADYDIGVRVITLSTHQVWESAVDNNATNPLTDTGDNWTLVGSTNRWKMFDQSPQSLTTDADTIAVEIRPDAYISAMAFLEVDAATITILGVIEVTGEIYSETFDMISDEGILDYEAYFFWPVERKTELYVNELPPFDEATWTIIFDSAGGENVSCGVLKMGREITLGNTAWGPRVGIEDYSLKQVDDYGNATVLERAYNRTGDFTLILTAAQVDAAYRRLSRIRATPVVWVGDPDYGSTLIYGFANDFAVEIAGPTVSYCNLSIKGLA